MGNPAARESCFRSPPAGATVADVMQIPPTTVDRNDHAAAAAYLMKHAAATVLMVVDTQTDQPVGIITEADIGHAVADEKDVNKVRINNLMTRRPTVVSTRTSIIDAARIMTTGRFRHLPVAGDAGLVGVVDITDVCRALIDADVSPASAGSRPQLGV